jgi:hypothetical protein
MTGPSSDYRAFLLRLWRTADGQWRASLEATLTGERRAFATLAQLADYLAQAVDGAPAAVPPDRGPPRSAL